MKSMTDVETLVSLYSERTIEWAEEKGDLIAATRATFEGRL
jgi:hypothetical protein